jgi:hypothetical protein
MPRKSVAQIQKNRAPGVQPPVTVTPIQQPDTPMTKFVKNVGNTMGSLFKKKTPTPPKG